MQEISKRKKLTSELFSYPTISSIQAPSQNGTGKNHVSYFKEVMKFENNSATSVVEILRFNYFL